MSGYGGASSGGGGGSQPLLDCGNISFNTDINSINKDAISGLTPNDFLEVKLIDGIVVVTNPINQEIIGSINWSHILQLIDCIGNGFLYKAKIRSIDDGLIKVHITPGKVPT